MKNLNTYQKVALATAGAIILLIQLIKFADDGIDGASWILSFAISALLFLPILSDVEVIVNKLKSEYVRSDELKNNSDASDVNLVGELFKELGAKAEKLHTLIADKGRVETIPFFNVISDRWYPSIAAIVVLTYGAAKKCDNADYYNTDEFKKLNGMLFNLLMSIAKHQDKLIGGAKTDDSLMRSSMGIVSNARKSVDLMFENISANKVDAEKPVHAFIQAACGFTDEYYKEIEGDVKRHINSLFVAYSNDVRLY